jgi:hypothetical protein
MSDPTPDTTPAVSQGPETRSLRRASRRLTFAVGFYLVLVAVLSAYIMIAIFPKVDMKALTPKQVDELDLKKTGDQGETRWQGLINLEFNPLRIRGWEIMPELEPAQGLLVLALLGGILGSFMHAGQSFAKYVGNEQLTSSWACWYFLRPPVGGILGLLFYFVLRAGLLSASVEAVSPYGVVAFGALAGWFSKQATEKLAEVFENLFRTEKTGETRDKLSAATPTITRVTVPATPPSTNVVLTVEGEHFLDGATAMLGQVPLQSMVASPTRLTAIVPADKRPDAGTKAQITVQNPGPTAVPSAPYTVEF